MQSEFKGTLSSHLRSFSRLPTSDHQSVETPGTDGSERKARVEVFSAHFAESCTDQHREWEMSSEYEAFEGFGIEDVQAETELNNTDSHEGQSWWRCLLAPCLRGAE
ncbi:hypothetical protein TGAMA5MH_00459 [Trichoderma gamsii]|uniref:Uncharacterized protein n=1 Tax=Trichoderma gamsii TaxID=398673 RepID=A0A2K0TSE7_9HYPO|nr:hypothetical protein TGAMA5MH_00459 [Trichoderma gamsii]